ncbi:Holliday junction ATP-dependent DNA helicase RuvB [Thalassoglobus neptunius]|uniref:Holliday junction ATP-dependent DNA helicase RuvB n=1 Tax=Thalassoglobus neptunius TaxID=1938619 RepID=A0A5C5X679_9PLAN|nr:MoxR family ATPase [Thalassoglobus neptunius]TWT58424.1 Holliday junction ATP-dependent DNA helicase RuvB [Thalassoglobus neptunius]
MTSDSAALIQSLEENIGRVLLGKEEVIRLAVVALLAEGHVLIEDAPGVGKTSLAKAIAHSFNCQFSRLQCTPDMLPSDILGSSIFLPNKGEFEFRAGPIFTNVLLADEINRTTPRTQSALLEAMMEHQVSVDGKTYPLSKPFFVLATQNPFEFEGTYPLPENQLDRFLLCTEIGYPSREAERRVFTSHRSGEPVEKLNSVLSTEQLSGLQQQVREVKVDESISDYILDLIEATRKSRELSLGVSTRGALTMYRAVQSLALVEGRDFAIPDDVKRLASPVFAHRVICSGVIRESQRNRARIIIQQMIDTIPVPN